MLPCSKPWTRGRSGGTSAGAGRCSRSWRQLWALKAHNDAPNIKVVGVGGSASSVVGELWDNEDLSRLHMIIVNTDVQELSNTWLPDHDKLLIGGRTTKWAGTQGDARLGQDAALESSTDIREALEGADLVLVLAGVAGGTGSGAAPVVAELARQQGALTIAMAMLPEHQLHQAEQVLQRLQTASDTAVAVTTRSTPSNGSGPSTEQLPLTCLVQGMADLLTGYEPVDLHELQEAVAGGSSSALGFASAHGPGRLTRATFAALSTQQCQPHLQHASGVLCFVNEADDLPEQELEEVQEVISSQCSSAATILVRAVPAGQYLSPDTAAVTMLVMHSAQASPSWGEAGGRMGAGSTTHHVADIAEAEGADGVEGTEEIADAGHDDTPAAQDNSQS